MKKRLWMRAAAVLTAVLMSFAVMIIPENITPVVSAEDEQQFENVTTDWYSMDYSTGVLTLFGQIPEPENEGESPIFSVFTSDQILKINYIDITPGTKAPVDSSDLFNLFNPSLPRIEGLTNLDTSNTTDMSGMFKTRVTKFNEYDVSNFDTSKVTDMSDMFFCYDSHNTLERINGLENFDTSNVTDMSNMFNGSWSNTLVDLNVSGFDTNKVTNMSGMFRGVGNAPIGLSNFDTSNVTDMSEMFCCANIEILDIS